MPTPIDYDTPDQPSWIDNACAGLFGAVVLLVAIWAVMS